MIHWINLCAAFATNILASQPKFCRRNGCEDEKNAFVDGSGSMRASVHAGVQGEEPIAQATYEAALPG